MSHHAERNLVHDAAEPSTLDYEAPPPDRPTGDRQFMTGGTWLILAGFCGCAIVAGWLATNGRTNSVGDILFDLALTVFGAIALVEAFRAPP
jgi:hypothetical protein